MQSFDSWSLDLSKVQNNSYGLFYAISEFGVVASYTHFSIFNSILWMIIIIHNQIDPNDFNQPIIGIDRLLAPLALPQEYSPSMLWFMAKLRLVWLTISPKRMIEPLRKKRTSAEYAEHVKEMLFLSSCDRNRNKVYSWLWAEMKSAQHNTAPKLTAQHKECCISNSNTKYILCSWLATMAKNR